MIPKLIREAGAVLLGLTIALSVLGGRAAYSEAKRYIDSALGGAS